MTSALKNILMARMATALLAAVLGSVHPWMPTFAVWSAYALFAGEPAHAQSRNAESVARIAEAITVRIEGATQGSGVLVKREGNRYTVLTAWHVVSGQRPGEELDIYTPDGKRHQLEQGSIQRLGQADLAVLRFASSSEYRLAIITNAKGLAAGNPLFVAGFPLATSAVPTRVFRFLEGRVVANTEAAMPNGYQVLYSSGLQPTMPGMSGGPVLDTQGQLAGIHGRSETEDRKTEQDGIFVKTGTNQAIPIRYYEQLHFDASVRGEPMPTVSSSTSRILHSRSEIDNMFDKCYFSFRGGQYPKDCPSFWVNSFRNSNRYSQRRLPRGWEEAVSVIIPEFCRYINRNSSYKVVPNPGIVSSYGSIGVMPGNSVNRVEVNSSTGECTFYGGEFSSGGSWSIDGDGQRSCKYTGSWLETSGKLIYIRAFTGCYRGRWPDIEEAQRLGDVEPDETFVFAASNSKDSNQSRLRFSFSEFLSSTD